MDRNNALISRVETQLASLAHAEEACALGLYGAADLNRCGLAGADPQVQASWTSGGAAAPWGAAVAVRESCANSFVSGVGQGVRESVEGVAALEGWDPQTRRLFVDEDNAVAAATGVGHLAFGALTFGPLALAGSHLKGPVGDLFRAGAVSVNESARSFAAVDTFRTNPAKAAGVLVFNLVTLLPMLGEVGAVKNGTGAAAGAARAAAKAGDLADPLSLAGRAIVAGSRLTPGSREAIRMVIPPMKVQTTPIITVADLRQMIKDGDRSKPRRPDLVDVSSGPERGARESGGLDRTPPVRHPDSELQKTVGHNHTSERGRPDPRGGGSDGSNSGLPDRDSGVGGSDRLPRLAHPVDDIPMGHQAEEPSILDPEEANAIRNPGATSNHGFIVHHEGRRIFVTTGRGVTYPIPEGWLQRMADNDRGLVFQKPGSVKNGNMIRIMEPTARYPDGYVRLHQANGQAVDVFGKPQSRPESHVTQTYRGEWPAWPE